jgi:hypothetical protein
MFKSKALALTVSKTAFAFLPILLAPICLGASVVLLDFYKLQLGLSIVAAVGSLGLGTYIYALAAHPSWSYSDRLDLVYAILLFKAVSTLIFLAGIVFSLAFYWHSDSTLHFKYVLLVPFAYFFVEQQIRLAKQHFFQAFTSFLMPPLIFTAILILTYILGEKFLNEICLVTLGLVDVVILKIIRLKSFKRTFYLRWKKIKQHLLQSKISTQIYNGIIVYICPPVATLIIIAWLERLHFTSQVIAAYYLYTRAIDAFVSLLITYFAAGFIQELMYRKKIRFTIKQISFYVCTLCAFYFSINYVINYLVEYMDFWMAILEVAIGLIKFCLAIFTLFTIKKYPKIIGAKELLIVIIIYLLSTFFAPENIYYFQSSIFLTFLLVFCIFLLSIRALKSSTSHI